MTDSIHQLSMKYISEQDRILFRLGTKNNTEYQMWFTRRFVIILWNSLHTLLSLKTEIHHEDDSLAQEDKETLHSDSTSLKSEKAHDRDVVNSEQPEQPKTKELSSEAREALLGMQHQEAIRETNFKKPHKKDNTILTAKTGPLLIANGTVTNEENATTKINLIAFGGAKIQFVLTKKLLHAFCQLLISSTTKAKWGLKLTVGDGNIAPLADGKTNLH